MSRPSSQPGPGPGRHPGTGPVERLARAPAGAESSAFHEGADPRGAPDEQAGPDGAAPLSAGHVPGAGHDGPGDPARSRRRRRDRHGHGLRTPLLPQHVPAWRSRSARFDDRVLDAVERLERRWSAELDGVEVAVEDVPPSDPAPWEDNEVPLGRLFLSNGELPARIVVYRRPVETRAPDEEDLGSLVHDVVVEQVAHLLQIPPEQVDPRYRSDT
jgi:predicted Zn-dependent protease with MMP-like domain